MGSPSVQSYKWALDRQGDGLPLRVGSSDGGGAVSIGLTRLLKMRESGLGSGRRGRLHLSNVSAGGIICRDEDQSGEAGAGELLSVC